MTASLVLLVLCLLVLMSNYSYRLHSKEVKESITTLYEDRLIAEVYIYNLTNNTFQLKEELNNSEIPDSEKARIVSDMLSGINKIIVDYDKTKLTEKEAVLFSKFKGVYSDITSAGLQEKKGHIKEALELLSELSALQMEVSQLIVNDSEKQYRYSKTSSDFAFVIVILILIVLQALVFASKTLHITNDTVNPNLN